MHFGENVHIVEKVTVMSHAHTKSKVCCQCGTHTVSVEILPSLLPPFPLLTLPSHHIPALKKNRI